VAVEGVDAMTKRAKSLDNEPGTEKSSLFLSLMQQAGDEYDRVVAESLAWQAKFTRLKGEIETTHAGITSGRNDNEQACDREATARGKAFLRAVPVHTMQQCRKSTSQVHTMQIDIPDSENNAAPLVMDAARGCQLQEPTQPSYSATELLRDETDREEKANANWKRLVHRMLKASATDWETDDVNWKTQLTIMLAEMPRSRNLVFPPMHPVKVVWSFLVALVMVLIVLLDPALLAIPEWEDHSIARSWVFACTVIFCIDIVVQFNSAIELGNHNQDFDRCKVARAYLKSWFLLDVLASSPWALFDLSGTGVPGEDSYVIGEGGLRWLKIIKLLHLFRVLLLFRQTGTLGDLVANFQTFLEDCFDFDMVMALGHFRSFLKVFRLIIFLLIEGHLISCVLLYNTGSELAESMGFNEATPMDRYVSVLLIVVNLLVTGNLDVLLYPHVLQGEGEPGGLTKTLFVTNFRHTRFTLFGLLLLFYVQMVVMIVWFGKELQLSQLQTRMLSLQRYLRRKKCAQGVAP
jgi:hypothetical protein